MALNCTAPALNTAMAAMRGMTNHQKRAALILYLYREKNPSTSGQVVPGDTLLASASCFRDCLTESDYLSGLVWVQRQEAADAGATMGTFSPSAVLTNTCQLNCMSDRGLRAIELLLRCQLS